MPNERLLSKRARGTSPAIDTNGCKKLPTTDRILVLRDLAVAAAMRCGAFETSGEARLVVFRQASLTIIYRTPFNPLPRMSGAMQYAAATNGRHSLLEPYGIEVWQERLGKVLSIGWRGERPPIVDRYEEGLWEEVLVEIVDRAVDSDADSGLGRHPISAPEHDLPGWKQLALRSGEANARSGAKGDAVPSVERRDSASARRSATRRAGAFCVAGTSKSSPV
jgi:hypothetical protein